jgi:hypothetical protein
LAQQLNGQGVRISFVADSLDAEDADAVLVDAEGLPGVSCAVFEIAVRGAGAQAVSKTDRTAYPEIVKP